jgi:hypothetical protein
MSEWLDSVLPLAGVVLGAAVTFWFSRTADKDKHVEEQRSKAYADYLQALAASAHGTNTSAAAADAKCRISVYGTSKVVQELAAFCEMGESLFYDEQKRAFLDVIAAMRAKDPVPEADLWQLMLDRKEREDPQRVK